MFLSYKNNTLWEGEDKQKRAEESKDLLGSIHLAQR